MVHHLTAMGRHLPYGFTQCYLPPDASEHAPHAGWYSIYLPWRDGRLSWPSWLDSARPGVEPATFWSRVRCRTTVPLRLHSVRRPRPKSRHHTTSSEWFNGPRLSQSTSIMKSTLTNGVLVLVSVNASIHHVVKQVIHDMCQTLGIQHAVQSTDEHRLLRFQTMWRLTHVVAVTQYPRDYLNLQVLIHTHGITHRITWNYISGFPL